MASLHFHARERLRSASAFQRLFRQGRCFMGDWMTLYVVSSPEVERKAGFVCEKKFFRKSVQRNRIKRRLRECYRLNKGGLKEGMELLIVAKKQMIEEPPFGKLSGEFLSLCQKAGIIA